MTLIEGASSDGDSVTYTPQNRSAVSAVVSNIEEAIQLQRRVKEKLSVVQEQVKHLRTVEQGLRKEDNDLDEKIAGLTSQMFDLLGKKL
jgi:hypothetical protein